MKTLKLNEEELELLIALYEEELKEARGYIYELQKTLVKLKNQIEIAGTEPAITEKKRGRKPRIQSREPKPISGRKRGRKPKSLHEVLMPISGKIRGKNPRRYQKYTPLVTMVEDMTSPWKRRTHKIKESAGLKSKEEPLPKVEIPVLE
jgi:hypothetical protein